MMPIALFTVTPSKRRFPATPKSRRILLLIVLLATFQSGFSQTKYVQKYRPLADSLSEEYGIPAAVILGVAIVESGSGTSRNAKMLNNHFGIVGKNKLLKTKGIKSRYKQYDSVEDSYHAFCKLLKKKKYYKKLKDNKDYKLWVDAISKSGYTEAPATWKQRVSDVIRKNKLAATR
jgi:flagellum-specific peptidoglycan hydrolase FlgJ